MQLPSIAYSLWLPIFNAISTWKDIYSNTTWTIVVLLGAFHKSISGKKILLYFLIFKNIYLFLERGEGEEKERERKINVREKYWSVASDTCADWDQTCNPGMCPDQESNQWLLALQDNTQTTEPHHSEWGFVLFLISQIHSAFASYNFLKLISNLILTWL